MKKHFPRKTEPPAPPPFKSPKPACSHTTKRGQPCRAPVIPGTDPPTCASHAGRNVGAGAPRGNQNRTTHGYYSRAFSPDELADLVACADDISLDDEIACARFTLRTLVTLLRDLDPNPAQVDLHARLTALILQGARTIARLLRDQRALSGPAGDGYSAAFTHMLDEIATELGLDS